MFSGSMVPGRSGGVGLRLLLCTMLAFQALLAEAGQRPNVLFILADDLGVNDIGAWGDGVAPTPVLDSLSSQSVRFRRHYTDSTCSVSRATLLTGRVPVSIGFEPTGLGLSPDLDTLPKSLQQLGYATHHVGKWHVGEAEEYAAVWPMRQGFDHWFGVFNHFVLQGPDASGRMVRRKPTYHDPWLQEDDGAPQQYRGHLDDLLADRAIQLIEQAAPDRPWFINLWFLAPHHPIEPSEAFAGRFPETAEGQYLALLNQLDHNVGRVLQALEESGQSANTIVMFGSDNGSPNLARDSNAPLVGKKTTYLEGGVRAPLLVRWPGHWPAGDFLSMSTLADLYPTLLGVLGSELPEGVDGLDLSNAIGRTATLENRALFWAADANVWGTVYGGHLPGKGGFYRDVFGRFSSFAMTGPVAVPSRIGPWEMDFDERQTSRLMADWERKHRPVPLEWDAQEGKLTGRDFQRAPVFGAWSLGLGLIASGPGSDAQILVEQPGVWRLELDHRQNLMLIHGGQRFEVAAPPLKRGCNSLVVSFNVQPVVEFPFPRPASGRFSVYLNGGVLMSHEAELGRPQTADALAQPTWIGRGADGSAPFLGRVGQPVVMSKFLLPEQPGFNLGDMNEALCSSAG